METLTLPAPELVRDPPTGPAALEKPVTVRLGAVRTLAGTEVNADEVRTLGVFVYRGPLGAEEIWDEAAKLWKTPAPLDTAGLSSLKPLPLSPAKDAPAPWAGTLVAMGQKDSSGAPQFQKASGGAPAYRLRPYAHAVKDGTDFAGIGAASPDLLFVSGTEQQRFTISFDTESANDAGRARLVLKNSALQPAGWVEIRAIGGQEVEIANATPSGGILARITLAASGDVRIAPAPGRQIVLEGPLEAERITYLPGGGGPRQTL